MPIGPSGPSGRHAVVRGVQALVCAALAAAVIALAPLLTPCSPALAFAQSGSASVVVWQACSFSQLNGADKTFGYRFEAITAEAPMPEGAQDGVYDWEMTLDERRSITVVYDEVPTSVCEYRMYQNVPEKKDGYTYDDTVYLARLYPTGASGGGAVMLVYDEDGWVKQPDPGWNVRYFGPSPSPESSSSSSSESPAEPGSNHGRDSTQDSSTNPASGASHDPSPDSAAHSEDAGESTPAIQLARLAETFDAVDIAVFSGLPILAACLVAWSVHRRRAYRRRVRGGGGSGSSGDGGR